MNLLNIFFQVARTIVVAEFQNVIYKEWLPTIFGPEILDKHKLRLIPGSMYDNNVNAQIRNEFTTAAFRFGHSLVQVIIKIHNNRFTSIIFIYSI